MQFRLLWGTCVVITKIPDRLNLRNFEKSKKNAVPTHNIVKYRLIWSQDTTHNLYKYCTKHVSKETTLDTTSGKPSKLCEIYEHCGSDLHATVKYRLNKPEGTKQPHPPLNHNQRERERTAVVSGRRTVAAQKHKQTWWQLARGPTALAGFGGVRKLG